MDDEFFLIFFDSDREFLFFFFQIFEKIIFFFFFLTLESEDVFVAKCLAKSGIEPWDTRDKYGRQRFHARDIGRALIFDTTKYENITQDTYWYYKYTSK